MSKKNKIKIPKDLGLKIVPKEQALWENVKLAREQSIKSLEDSLIIEKAFLKCAEENLELVKQNEIKN
jgi:hypothetical protein